MSASSGITVSSELSTAFSEALTSRSVRFIKVSIKNESLVTDKSIPPSGTFEEDLDKLADLVQDDIPAYILARQDNPHTDWLAVFYVPDSAKVRDKMLYASTRTSLTKSLGSAPFKDTMFATSKDDLSRAAYAKHRASLAAPKPMTAREKEMDEIRQAENRSATYEGSRARVSHSQEVGLGWAEEVEEAIRTLGSGEGSRLVILHIDHATETLRLHSDAVVEADAVGASLPQSDPAFAFFAWAQPTRRDIVFIYSCPSSSSIKHRMLYSSSFISTSRAADKLLIDAPTKQLSRRLQTSDPKEIDERYLRADLASVLTGAGGAEGSASVGGNAQGAEKPAFARPKGPVRRH
ncbi:actin depolymerizing protein [Irpex rosettiformis]|uniref:Actin depolymerizing protein n=1 Tax=Irpex rosettiformis TaxID=378272 RepID=A0ACB8UHC8_9APHY|nr:actin depolymerizing protein [Irpex rosettiformis]